LTDTELAKAASELRRLLEDPGTNALGLDLADEIRLLLAREYAARRGWRLADRPFSIFSLLNGSLIPGDRAQGIEQKNCFADEQRLPVAIAHHLPGPMLTEEMKEWARGYRLAIELVPDFPSWLHPGMYTLAIFARAEHGRK